MRPNAIPVRSVGSRAVLGKRDLEAAFGRGATLRPSATVEVVRLGQVLARVPIEAGDQTRLVLDATDALEHADGLSLRGPVGAVSGPEVERVCSRLVIQSGLRRAWGVGDRATLGLGSVAAAVTVEVGPALEAEIDRALWLGAGRPETARWLPGLVLEIAVPDEPVEDGRIDRRVITENDVRQARRRRVTIRVRPGQIVTPAARSLGQEWGVFESREAGEDSAV
ncbi:hypothetical protein [Rubrivirga sp.]|uniref:hypothetical protein n=1 Tax=Rubrivirga sp. TaxID=1885344 RepID=UPI003C795CE0